MHFRRRALCSLAVVFSVLWGSVFSQCPPTPSTVCGSTLNVTASGLEFLPLGVVTCFQCRTSNPSPPGWQINSVEVSNPANAEIMNEQLIIYDPACGLMQTTSNIITCRDGGFSVVNVQFIVAPLVPASVTVNESDTLMVTCDISNSNGPFILSTTWRNAQDSSEVDNDKILVRAGVNRNFTGEYFCVARSRNNEDYNSTITTIIVQYIPDVNTTIASSILAPVDQTLTLSCDYKGVPVPSITWSRGVTVLEQSDTRVTINSTDTHSDLLLSSLASVEGGEYTCTASNLVGDNSVSVMVTVQVPPEPPTMPNAMNATTTTIPLSWSLGSDGNSPLTEVVIEYLSLTGVTDSGSVRLGPAATSTTLMGLQPLTNYRLQVFAVNAIGRSGPATTNHKTMSLVLTAPISVSLATVNSTALTLTWASPLVPGQLTTAEVTSWIGELQLSADGTVVVNFDTGDPNTLTQTFTGLQKGTSYRARVAGVNVRGPGAYSELMTAETSVDPPSMVTALDTTAVTAFAFSVTWGAPDMNGGRPITSYLVHVCEVEMPSANSSREPLKKSMEVSPDTFIAIFRGDDINANTTYSVAVNAENSIRFRSDNNTVSVTTQSIDVPQPIIDKPISPMNLVTNESFTITWVLDARALLVVINFIVQYKLVPVVRNDASYMNITVPGNMTYVKIVDLKPNSDYDVRIITENANGMSAPSPIVTITTGPTPSTNTPVITSSTMGQVSPGTTVTLTCTVADDPDGTVTWLKDNVVVMPSSTSLTVVGNMLTIDQVQASDAGNYTCRAANTRITVYMLTVTPVGGIGNDVIIIAAVVGGVGGIIFIVVLIIALYCCCRWMGHTSSKKSYEPKPKKKLNWIETSNQFVPSTTPGTREQESGPAFDIPESYREASSFNTLEKQNRIRRSPSPPQESGNVYATEPVDVGVTNPHLTSTSYEVGSPSFQYVPSPTEATDGGDMAGEKPHYSNTVV